MYNLCIDVDSKNIRVCMILIVERARGDFSRSPGDSQTRPPQAPETVRKEKTEKTGFNQFQSVSKHDQIDLNHFKS